MRGGVPVFSRPSSRPRPRSAPDRPSAAASPIRPPLLTRSPQISRPFSEVPVQSTMARRANDCAVEQPHAGHRRRPPACGSSQDLLDRALAQRSRFGCDSRTGASPRCRHTCRTARAAPARRVPCRCSACGSGCWCGRHCGPSRRPARRSRTPDGPWPGRRSTGCRASAPHCAGSGVSSSVRRPMRAARPAPPRSRRGPRRPRSPRMPSRPSPRPPRTSPPVDHPMVRYHSSGAGVALPDSGRFPSDRSHLATGCPRRLPAVSTVYPGKTCLQVDPREHRVTPYRCLNGLSWRDVPAGPPG